MAVSTMTLRIERRGSWVVSSTIELVPVHHVLESGITAYRKIYTEFYNDSEMFLHFELCLPLN